MALHTELSLNSKLLNQQPKVFETQETFAIERRNSSH